MFEEEEGLQKDEDKHPDENPLKSHVVGALLVCYQVRLDFQSIVHHVS